MAFSYLCAPQVGWKVSPPGEQALGVMWIACGCVIVEQLSRTLLCFGAAFTSVDSGAAEACGGGDEGVARREW